MIFRILYFTFLSVSLVELCVPTIPPEDVYITSTGANLPGDPEEELTTEAAVGTETPGPEAPGTEAPGTDAPESPPVCDINTIAPILTNPDDTEFYTRDEEVSGLSYPGTATICATTNGDECTDIFVYDVTPTGNVLLNDETEPNGAGALLVCQKDGTYKWRDTTTITQLSCVFEGCEQPQPPSQCNTCDINSIKPMTTPPNSEYLSGDLDPVDGCKVSFARCSTTVAPCESVSIMAQTITGYKVLVNEVGVSVADATLLCGADGKYMYGTRTGITELYCIYDCP